MMFSQIDPRGNMLYSEHNASYDLSGLNSQGSENKQGRALIEKTSQAKLLIWSLQYGCVRRSQIISLQPLPEPTRKVHGTCQVLT